MSTKTIVTDFKYRLTVRQDFRKNWQIYLMAIPILAYFIIFNYIPMSGLIMAFQEYSPKGGIWGSTWVGLKNFTDFFESYYFFRLLRNTFLISVYDLIFNFPLPIIFALLLNEVRVKLFKRVVQTISYLPYFISLVVICGLILDFTNSNGIITGIVGALGGKQVNLIQQPGLFRTIFVASNAWQWMGFNSIIFIAALSAIDPELYEAAVIDGAGKLRQMWHITLPGILSIIIILLILRIGTLLSVGYEKIILLYSPLTYETGDVISSFVYRKGIQEMNYGYSTAVGLFNSVINLTLLMTSNWISRRFSETSLF